MTVRSLSDLLSRFSNARHGNEGQDYRDALESVYPDGSGAGAVGLLAVTAYNPGSVEAKSTTSATFEDADAANLLVSFIAPPSGNVLVKLGADGRMNSSFSSREYFWGLREGAADVVGSGQFINRVTDVTRIRMAYSAVINGLTAGQIYTWKWAHRAINVSGGESGQIFVGGINGQAVMEIWAAP